MTSNEKSITEANIQIGTNTEEITVITNKLTELINGNKNNTQYIKDNKVVYDRVEELVSFLSFVHSNLYRRSKTSMKSIMN